MNILLWLVVLFSSGYSFWYAYYLIKGKNRIGAFGVAVVGILIVVLSFWVNIE